MRIVIVFLLGLLVAGSLVGCANEAVVSEERISNVVRVFWHEKDRYSIMVRKPGSKILSTKTFPKFLCHRSGGVINIISDVENNDDMWVYAKIKTGELLNNEPGTCILRLDIHIKSEKNIEGGEWDHGKLGKGMTHVIS